MLLAYYREGKDGTMALERHEGYTHLRTVAAFGESVMYLPLSTKENQNSCPDSRFRDGKWLGLDVRTGEVYMGTPSGVVKACTVKRKIGRERRNAYEVMIVRGSP